VRDRDATGGLAPCRYHGVRAREARRARIRHATGGLAPSRDVVSGAAQAARLKRGPRFARACVFGTPQEGHARWWPFWWACSQCHRRACALPHYGVAERWVL
jgi:hypothetical protein